MVNIQYYFLQISDYNVDKGLLTTDISKLQTLYNAD